MRRRDSEKDRAATPRRAAGQVIIEILLVLPLFLMVVFVIMEVGHLAFQTIVLHHCTFELARIGSMSAAPRPGEGWTPRLDRAKYQMEGTIKRMFPRGNAVFRTIIEDTLMDRQSTMTNRDIIVSVEYRCPLVFPFTSMILENDKGPTKTKIGGGRYRILYADVRMPIQQPTYQ